MAMPPLKSMPKFSPRTASRMAAATMTTIERPTAICRYLTKLIFGRSGKRRRCFMTASSSLSDVERLRPRAAQPCRNHEAVHREGGKDRGDDAERVGHGKTANGARTDLKKDRRGNE